MKRVKIDKKRHILKSITWKILATSFTFLITWIITGNLKIGIGVGILDVIIKILLYYFHERIWYKSNFGVHHKRGKVLWFTGLSGSGKSTIANLLSKELENSIVLDGDILRSGLSKDLGFSKEDRTENHRRVAEVAKIISNLGYNVIVAFISPYEIHRKTAKEILGDKYVEIYISTSIDECIKRDPKGLYKRVKDGNIKNFTGIDDPYEIPKNPDIIVNTKNSPKDSVSYLFKRIYSIDGF